MNTQSNTQSIDKPNPAQRGQSFEYALTQQLQDRGCIIDDDTWSEPKKQRLGEVFSSLSPRQQQSIMGQASSCADAFSELTPLGDCVINLVRGEAGRNQVHDLSLTNTKTNQVFYISAKTDDKVEDKAYRFSDATYVFHNALKHTQFLTPLADTGISIEDALKQSGVSVEKFHKDIVNSVAQSLVDRDDDYLTMVRYVKDRAIGSGGYYKTTKSGGVEYYEFVNDVYSIDNVAVSGKTVFFDAHVSTDVGNMVYSMSFRVKFKDGKSKPLMLSKNGAMRNLAATVRITSRKAENE